MSSAALQSAPHQPTTLSSPPLPSSSNRQYASPHSSPSREGYNAHQAVTSSPSSKRPPSRKTSGHDASPSIDQTVPRSSRNGTSASSTQEHRSSRSERQQSNMPPVAPPRTSSSAQPAPSSRRAHYPNDPTTSSPRHNQGDGSRSGSRGDTNGYSDTSRSKRVANSHLPQEQARPSSNRDNRAPEMTIPIRTNPTNAKPAHDASDNLIRAISNTEEPNGRTAHHTAPQDHHDVAQPPVVPMNPPAEERRGGRSRHDHSRSHKGTTKFGDFILGNTIGEGEFGKVKLGWKQDSSVQV